ncbi:MAG: CBS domain-containing protein [Thermodesulfobacteriota bacterium]
MKVHEVMTPNIKFVHPDDSIQKAAEKMKDINIGALPVTAGDEVVGIMTDRDIVIRSTAQGLDPEKHKVVEVVTQSIISVNEEDDIKTVADLMEDKQIRRVLVKNKEGKVTGIVSLGDLAVNIKTKLAGEILKEVSEPAEPAR